MVGNKIADKITKVSRKVSSQNSPGIVTNETENNGIDREIPNERYISSEKKYQKIINLLENTPNQPSKYRTKKWAETSTAAVDPQHLQVEVAE